MSLPPEVLKQVKLLELNTRKLVNNLFAGEYHTLFKGQGMTFADFREYVPGDDIRSISWPVTAKTGKTFIKRFEEERELSLVLAVDISGSTDFGTGQYIKGEIMAHIAALLAFSAVKNNDHVGLLLFTDQIEHYIPPKKGRNHVHRLLRDLLYFKPERNKTSLKVAFDHLQGVLKKRATIFVLSDFFDEGYDQSLRWLGKKHEVIACVVNDKTEVEWPSLGLMDLQDPETGEIMTVDTSSHEFQQGWQRIVKQQKSQRDLLLARAQVDVVSIVNNERYFDPLIEYFRKRKIR